MTAQNSKRPWRRWIFLLSTLFLISFLAKGWKSIKKGSLRRPRKAGHFLAAAAAALLLQTACTQYKPPATSPPMEGARIVGKIVEGAAPAFEPKEDPKKSYFIVTPGYVLYYNFLQGENAEQKMTIEGLRAELKKKK